MRKFNEFVESQTIDGKIIEAATLMAEKNVEPNVFLQTWYETNEPELAVYLSEAGVWDGIKQGASAAWNGIKQGASAAWNGAQQGVQNYNRAVNGPMAKYQAAVNSLKILNDYMSKDPQLASTYSRLVMQIGKILNDLKTLAPQIPDNNNGKWQAGVDPVAQNMGQAGGNHAPYTEPTPPPTGTSSGFGSR